MGARFGGHSWKLLLAMLLLAGNAAFGQDFPSKPITIVTSEAGGGNDFVAHQLAQGIAGTLGTQVTVDNRGSGVVPGEIVSKAPPDGHMLLVFNNTLWVGPLMQNAPYDAVKDFAPIAWIGSTPHVLVVSSASSAKSVAALVAMAKARQGELKYGVSGIGASNHLAGELFAAMAGVKLVPVLYKGGGTAVNALIAGDLQLMFPTAISAAPQVKSGKLTALAVTSAQPSVLVPGVPTVAASGLPGYEAIAMFAAFAPAATPRAIIGRLNEEIVRFLGRDDVKEKFLTAGLEIVAGSPEQLAATMQSEIVRMGNVIRSAGIRAY